MPAPLPVRASSQRVTKSHLLPAALEVAAMSRVELEVNDLALEKSEVTHLEGRSQSLESTILQWAANQPSWCSAALHIALQGEYTAEQVDALAIAACREAGVALGIDNVVEPTGFDASDLGSIGSSQREVLLESITAETGINAIEPGSKLDVATTGITVIYGNNGSGKSGFSRMIRNACTSRTGSENILSNVFESKVTPSASFSVKLNGIPTSFTWKDGETPYPTFPEIAYFDSACAAMEIGDKDNAILYAPGVISSLALLPGLITAVANRIQQQESRLIDSLDARAIPSELRSLPEVTALLSCSSEAEATRLIGEAALSTEEVARRAMLPKLIESDPSVELPKLERRHSQLKAMRERLAELYQCCQPSFGQAFEKARAAVDQAMEAAKAASALASNNSPLDGFGSDAWKALWEAARKYSDSFAYVGSSYPKLPKDSLCPLCQQPLGVETMARMDAFEAYVNGVAEKNLAEKSRALSELETRFINAVRAVKSDASGIGIMATDQARSEMDALMRKLESVAAVPDVAVLESLSAHTQQAGKYVRDEIDALAQRMTTLREGMEPGNAEKLKSELLALNARAWIDANKELLAGDAKNRETRKGLEAARKKCNTRSATTLISAVSKVEVVERMQSAFAAELKRLKASNQQVAISTRARAGQEYQRITLEGASASTRSVLSEGEQKIVALAGFFALLDVMPGNSTVILDDPITSLDHLWRAAVAERIVEEAKSRPVVVFTHEPMFCYAISELSAKQDVPVAYRTVQKRGTLTGIVMNELDWDASNVKKRIGALRNRANDLRRLYKACAIKTDAELGKELRDCYSDLRSTWERAVEQVLLAGVVKRAERPIHTQQMKWLSDITDEDIRIVEENMTKCSLLTNAHDDPLATPDSLPTIQEFEDDVNALDEWRKTIEDRRRKANRHA